MSRILVIDDNELVSMMLKEQLSHEGYEVALAQDANQGYAAAIEFLPDLILLDVQLPDVVGFDLIRIIKNRDELRHIPIMMITGTAHSTADKVKGFQMGADDYVLKPFEMPELMERIKAILRRSELSVRHSTEIRSQEGIPVSTTMAAAVPKPLSIHDAAWTMLLNPLGLPDQAPLPPATMPYLMTLFALILGGLILAAGETVKPAVAGLSIMGAWIILTSALVVVCSVSGIACSWRDGGRLLSLAGIPLLLKMAGATVSTLWTTVSPFDYSAGLALFWPSAPYWAGRMDVFELWSLSLLWILVRKRNGGTPKRAWVATAVVAIVAWVLGAGLSRLGGS